MCFSITASLTTSAILIPIGLYATYYAAKHRRPYLLLALIPIFFGIQQFTEGIVWYGLHHQDVVVIHYASLAYLFFAYFWWPMFIPLSVYFVEDRHHIRKILLALTMIGLALGAGLYIPVLTGIFPLYTTIINKSIEYTTYQSEPIVFLLLFFYVLVLVSSFWIASNKHIKLMGILLLFGFSAAALWYAWTFTSVWCFFAAFISFYVVYVVRK